MEYKQRTTAPTSIDKNWLRPEVGGYNKCIEINNGSCLPNCVGYCWGRWRELLGKDPNLSRGNAETWFLNTKDGYKRGQTPKLGAVICYSLGSTSTGKDGCGHVAIVEQINDDGSFVISESNYGGIRWRRVNLTKSCKYGKLVFQGFIYFPIEFDDPEEDEPSFTTGKNYTLVYTSVVRKGPGVNYTRLTKAQLTKYAQKYATSSGCLKKGTVITCQGSEKDSKGNIWVKIPSGWIPAWYDNDICLK